MRSFALNDTCPVYTALSYKWDYEPSKDTILLNGIVKSVGRNLWTFLNRMRLRGKFGPFWIDALCINQADIKERNHQVQMMKNIYSSAHFVSIWLGESEQDSRLHEAMLVLESWLESPYILSGIPDSSSDDFCLYRLEALYNHEYWRRCGSSRKCSTLDMRSSTAAQATPVCLSSSR